ncbi:MAG TPA: glycosyltransferase [Bacilli bacterium]|nr:glycosyltransferase [Bacilli bacterium]
MDYSKLYDEYYYMTSCGDISYLESEKWRPFYEGIADKIVKDLNPSTVLDVGCAVGYLVAALRDRGVKAYGIDISEFAVSKVREDIKPYCMVWSATEPLPEAFPQKYDLLITIEVAEHLYEEDASKFIENICRYSDKIIFSSTPDDIYEKTHFNVQQAEYWAKRFAQNKFFKDLNYDVSYISPQSCLFAKQQYSLDKLVEDYERHVRIIRSQIQQMQKEYRDSSYISTLFLDYGNGFTGEASIVKTSTDFEFYNEYEIDSNVKAIRFDPVEGKGCIVHNLEIISNNGQLRAENLNGAKIDTFNIFTTKDPQLLIELNNKPTSWVRIKATIIPFETMAMYVLLSKFFRTNKENQEIIAELEEKSELLNEIQAKEARIDELLRINELKEAEFLEILKSKDSAIKDYEEKLKISDRELKHYKSHYMAAINQRDNLTCKLEEIIDELLRINELKEAEFLEILKSKDSAIKDYEEKLKISDRELKHYKSHYMAAINQRDNLTCKLEEINEAYQLLRNSTCWKITKPLRAFLDLIKKLLKSNPVTLNFCKGVKSLKQHGVKYTWGKVKNKLSTKHRMKEYYKTNILSEEEKERQKSIVFSKDIKFSILVPLYNTPERYLIEMIESVIAQTYGNWELCLADGSDAGHGYVQKICKRYSKDDSRIIYKKLEKNEGISGNTNACANLASGEYLALLDHDDLLYPNALYENVLAINETGADILYSDEDHINKDGIHGTPFFKPDWSVDLLYSQMYVCHFLVFKRCVFEQAGGFNSNYDGSQDYDLMLRLSEISNSICHIPKVLYSWRESDNSTAANPDSKPYAHVSGLNALDAHLKRKYGEYAHAESSEFTFVYDARFNLLMPEIKVSIIIPMKDNSELTNNCIESILSKTTYSNYEILIINNRSSEKSTYEWFETIKKKDSRIKIVDADIEFNWSKINNIGMENASGEVYVFLNNDTLVITEDWLERLCENALRDDIGIVGGLLLYDDNKIQHAGVVVGFGGWADHVYKNMDPIHYGCPFVSPMVNRNVLAVTGACMAVSKKTIELIGKFNEEFIICGSDVEICIRSHEAGLYNLYNSRVKLYHLESKSRDSYIPEKDFEMSAHCYSPYIKNGDPYYNINLSLDSIQPKEKSEKVDIISFKNFLKHSKLTAPLYKKAKKLMSRSVINTDVPEVQPIEPRSLTEYGDAVRLNLLIPSIDKQHVFGGISTALKFFTSLVQKSMVGSRIIVTDSTINLESSIDIDGYTLADCSENSNQDKQIIGFSDRYKKTIPVAKNDIFIATGWWTAYNIIPVVNWQYKQYGLETINKLIYFIQDYEPGFYPWSSKYLMADSTYKSNIPTIAIFNSKLLKDFFSINNYKFETEYYFEPTLNDNLKKYFIQYKNKIRRKKQILVYGRPSTQRNAFELIVLALKEWCKNQKNVKEWTVLSAGESHPSIDLGKGVKLRSIGKLSLEEYAKTMYESYAGISLMVSPHPSYPPLEMSTFGIKTITNSYANKDLSSFSNNIISISDCSAINVANKLMEVCANFYTNIDTEVNQEYLRNDIIFEQIIDQITKLIIK